MGRPSPSRSGSTTNQNYQMEQYEEDCSGWDTKIRVSSDLDTTMDMVGCGADVHFRSRGKLAHNDRT